MATYGSLRLSRCYAVSVDKRRPDQCADQPYPLLDQVDGGTLQLQLIAPANVPSKVERSSVTDQRANLVNPRADYGHLFRPGQSPIALCAFAVSLAGATDGCGALASPAL